jgi:2-polyprenyl-3-methyl-5-hydroxy-6-metoxy-1,4-benzoquinol methylase
MSAQVSGTEGYADQAKLLFDCYESIRAADAHRPTLHLIPAIPSHVLDIGSGTGRDAAWFADMGHRVVAVEPTDDLRIPAMARHTSLRIEWLDDSLPDLAVVRRRGERFDLVTLIAVWMHLDGEQRRQAMPNIAELVTPGGTIIMTVRHGPVPAGRRMFEIPAEEIIGLAQMHGLRLVLNLTMESTQAQNRSLGITWTHLAFAKACNP